MLIKQHPHSDSHHEMSGDGGDGQALLADFPSNGSGMLPRCVLIKEKNKVK